MHYAKSPKHCWKNVGKIDKVCQPLTSPRYPFIFALFDKEKNSFAVARLGEGSLQCEQIGNKWVACIVHFRLPNSLLRWHWWVGTQQHAFWLPESQKSVPNITATLCSQRRTRWIKDKKEFILTNALRSSVLSISYFQGAWKSGFGKRYLWITLCSNILHYFESKLTS